MAEQLGAETATLTATDPAEEVVRFARSRNVTKIIVGKTDQPRWKSLFFGSFLDDLLRRSGEIDVYVIRGVGDPSKTEVAVPARAKFDWRPYAWTSLIVALAALLSGIVKYSLGAKLAEANIVALFLVSAVLSAFRFGRWPGVYASIATVLIFDFFFVPPALTFAISDTQYLFTFGVILAISLLVSALAARGGEQSAAARERERRTQSLYRLTRQLAGASGTEFLVGMAGKQISDLFGGEVVIYLRDEGGALQVRFGRDTSVAKASNSHGVAQWVYDHDQMAGAGTETLSQTIATFVPMTGSQTVIGVIALHAPDQDRLRSPDQRRLLETCASQIALALERDMLTLEANQVHMQAETERLRSSLLSSVSHDLRTPLAAISGASSSLLESSQDVSPVKRELLETIYDESHRLSRLVDNLLQMTRIESGGIQVHKEWEVLEEIVGSALQRLHQYLGNRPVRIDIPQDLPLVPMDGLLIEQVLINLLDNALKYSPPGAELEVKASASGRICTVEVCDRGPGIAPSERGKIFEKFYRGHSSENRQGAGLGLAICQAIVRAHGGSIQVENRAGGGARFSFTIPIEGTPPVMNLETTAARA